MAVCPTVCSTQALQPFFSVLRFGQKISWNPKSFFSFVIYSEFYFPWKRSSTNSTAVSTSLKNYRHYTRGKYILCISAPPPHPVGFFLLTNKDAGGQKEKCYPLFYAIFYFFLPPFYFFPCTFILFFPPVHLYVWVLVNTNVIQLQQGFFF